MAQKADKGDGPPEDRKHEPDHVASHWSQIDEWRAIFDELETQRIAIYPIDVRGLTVVNYPINAHGLTMVTRNGMLAQHALMNDVAEATGGHAVYDNNGLAQVAGRLIDEDGEYYTLTYSPHQFAYDNKWHQIKVTVSGTNYTLSYRRGYFADGFSPMHQAPKRTRLKVGGSTEVISSNQAPIVFEAQIHPGMPTMVISETAGKRAPQKGALPYTIEYSLPLDAFNIKRVDGKWKVDCGAEIIALNPYGSVISHQAKLITFTLREEAALHPVGQDLLLEEEIDLTKGDVYVYVAVFDRGSKRLGSMEIPYHVDVLKQAKDSHASK
ncbi:MAG TPA: VWA domain-containing protein [Rhizomicrobium sp.]|nr:VWA domain-containing protein [Rhizomicrobium sp.]